MVIMKSPEWEIYSLGTIYTMDREVPEDTCLKTYNVFEKETFYNH